jgi:hypothetical protein
VVPALWMVGAGSKRTSGQEAPHAKKHFLEVGKQYRLTSTVIFEVRILDEPRDNWVKVTSLGEEQPKKVKNVWLNLGQVLFIEEK